MSDAPPGHERGTCERSESAAKGLVPGVRIRVAVGNGRKLTGARIVKQSGTRLLLSLHSLSPEVRADLLAGTRVRLLSRGENAGYWHDATVVARPTSCRLLIKVAPIPPERVQQRQYFRMRVRLSLFAEEIETSPPSKPRNSSVEAGLRAHLRLLALRNLSGGGCLCCDPRKELRPGTVYRLHLCLPDGAPPLPVEARVVRTTRVGGQRAAGLSFVGLLERDRERILRVLFQEYRRSRTRMNRNEDP
jgi:c-di-GMP-binding flagellar brake protein YcgR